MNCLFKLSLLGVFLIFLIAVPFPLFGEEKNSIDPYERDPLFLNKMNIKGSVLTPGISHTIPWKSPESLEEGGSVTLRSHLPDMLVPLEPEDFEWAVRNNPDGMESDLGGNKSDAIAEGD